MNKKQACDKGVQLCNQLINEVKQTTTADLNKPKVNNKIIKEVIGLVHSKPANYLRNHELIRNGFSGNYQNYFLFDGAYLDCGSISNLDTFIKENIQTKDNNYTKLVKGVKDKAFALKNKGYKYCQNTHITQTKPDDDGIGVDILGETYTDVFVPTQKGILDAIKDFRQMISYSFIKDQDRKTLVNNIKLDKEILDKSSASDKASDLKDYKEDRNELDKLSHDDL